MQTPAVQLRPVVSTLSGVGPLTEVPVPVRLTVWVLLKLLSSTVRIAVRVPVAVGVKTIVIVHDPPAATELPTHRSLVRLKSSPVVDTPLMNCEAVPWLVNVNVCATLVVPTACEPNVIGDGLSVTEAGAGGGGGGGVPPPPPP